MTRIVRCLFIIILQLKDTDQLNGFKKKKTEYNYLLPTENIPDPHRHTQSEREKMDNNLPSKWNPESNKDFRPKLEETKKVLHIGEGNSTSRRCNDYKFTRAKCWCTQFHRTNTPEHKRTDMPTCPSKMIVGIVNTPISPI
jgi:hypothetical protein